MKKFVGWFVRYGFAIFFGLALSQAALAETVFVKYRGTVDLAPFHCEWVSRSSFIKRLCYDPAEKYVIVKLDNTYYHYCEVPSSLVNSWRSAPSMGQFYNSRVKGNYDCRILHMPTYDK